MHMLRTRRMGSDGMVDVHILVNPKISVSEGHRISDTVRAQIIRNVDDVTDVMVHIDPEDDEKVAPSSGLPLRKEVLKILGSRWQGFDAAKHLEDTVLHYLDGKIHVELLLPLDEIQDATEAQSIADELRRLALEEESISDVQIRFY
jgi:divalent metal cation (Fe/Co/Zn/Cd) transporter